MTIADKIRSTLGKVFDNSIVSGVKTSVPISISWTEGAAYNAATGMMSGGTEFAVETTALPSRWTRAEMAGGLVAVNDVKVTVPVDGFPDGPPPIGARVSYMETTYRIKRLPGSTIFDGAFLMHRLHLEVA